MLDSNAEVTVSEAGYLLDRPVKALNRKIDDGVITVRVHRVPKRPVKTKRAMKVAYDKLAVAKVKDVATRLLGRAELRFLKVEADLRKDLTESGRKKVYEAIRSAPPNAKAVQVGPLEVKFVKVDKELTRRLEQLAELRNSVVERNGVVCLKGTDVPVYPLAALQKSLTLRDIVDNYPTLSFEQIQTAFDYAKAYPKAGRPYPATTLKRRLAELAAGGAFDGEPDQSAFSPDMFK